MRVLAKKAYEFALRVPGKGKVQSVKVEPFIVTTVPDWAENDGMFQAAQKSGNISVIQPQATVSVNVAELFKQATDAGIKDPDKMTLAQLQEAMTNIIADKPQATEGMNADKPQEAPEVKKSTRAK